MISTAIAKLVGERVAGPLAEALKVLVIVAAMFVGTWWLRHDAARDATAASEAQCRQTIHHLEVQQREEADRRAEDAQSAGEALPPAPAARRELERLCAIDDDCRDKDRLRRGQ